MYTNIGLQTTPWAITGTPIYQVVKGNESAHLISVVCAAADPKVAVAGAAFSYALKTTALSQRLPRLSYPGALLLAMLAPILQAVYSPLQRYRPSDGNVPAATPIRDHRIREGKHHRLPYRYTFSFHFPALVVSELQANAPVAWARIRRARQQACLLQRTFARGRLTLFSLRRAAKAMGRRALCGKSDHVENMRRTRRVRQESSHPPNVPGRRVGRTGCRSPVLIIWSCASGRRARRNGEATCWRPRPCSRVPVTLDTPL